MNTGEISNYKGKTYQSPKDKYIDDEDTEDPHRHLWSNGGDPSEYFRPATEDEIAKAKTENILNKALDFIVERVNEGDDYICEEFSSIPVEWNYCKENCQNLNRECVLRYLKRRK